MNSSKISLLKVISLILLTVCVFLIVGPQLMMVRTSCGGMSDQSRTRNMLNQYKAMVSSYYTDYQVLPDSSHVNLITYSDSISNEYLKRIPSDLFNLNQIPQSFKKNAYLNFDYFDPKGINNYDAFCAKYSTQSLVIPLEPWYEGASTAAKIEQEEVKVITHSSRFLNYYLSGSGFNIEKVTEYIQEEKQIGNKTTSFRPSFEKNILIRPFVYFLTDNTVIWNGKTPEERLLTIPTFTSFKLDKELIYSNYIPKIIGNWDSQVYSKNFEEDKLRRLYIYSDCNADGSEKPLPILSNKNDSKKSLLGSDRILFNKDFYSSSTDKENNSISHVYMMAHTYNVKSIVDAFNSPIVYITYTNQRKECARTYSIEDSSKVKNKALKKDSFILYSLGKNKMDDSNLGENYLNKLSTGDDIIEFSEGR
jgi:hypothetical protein